jgi:integrase
MASFTKLPSGHWRALVRIKGHPAQSNTFRTKLQAQRWATKIEDQIRSGAFKDTTAAENRYLFDHLEWYYETITPRKAPSALRRELSRLRILSEHPALKSCTLATLTTDTVLKYVDARKKDGMSSDTIVKELSTLSHALDAGVGLLRIVLPHGNPVKQARDTLKFTRTLRLNPARDRRLFPGEEQKLLAELGPVMCAAVILLLETGMRREELCNARREHIRGNTLFIPETKTETSRTIPLSPRALETIRQLPARMDGLILGHRPDSVTQAFARACQRAGIEDLRLHDLRHEATSRLFERGWSIPEVAAVTGHSDWATLKRYTQLRPADLADKLQNGQWPPPHRGSGNS